MKAEINKAVADFDLPASGDQNVRLKPLRGKKVVLYFYPRDHTPGCTRESADFAALAEEFARENTEIIGVSRDPPSSHRRFREKLNLPFELISDQEQSLCRQFAVLKDKSMFGRKMKGVVRSTFLIDEKGILRREWRNVKVAGHAQEVLEAVRNPG